MKARNNFPDQLLCPAAADRIIELRRTRNRILAKLLARQIIIKQIRNKQQSICVFKKHALFLRHGQKLIQRIEFLKCNPRRIINFFFRRTAACKLDHTVRARVAVMNGIPEQFPLPRKQTEVHAPGIDPDPRNFLMPGLIRFQDAFLQFEKQTRKIPRKRPVHHNRIAGKAMELRKRKPRAIELTQDGSSAACSVIKSQ